VVTLINMEKEEDKSLQTIEAVCRFNEAFNRHDVDAIMNAMTADCVFENTGPTPDGARYQGQEAVRAFWEKFFRSSPDALFETEEMFAAGDRLCGSLGLSEDERWSALAPSRCGRLSGSGWQGGGETRLRQRVSEHFMDRKNRHASCKRSSHYSQQIPKTLPSISMAALFIMLRSVEA
jgi:predicted ester cyclase